MYQQLCVYLALKIVIEEPNQQPTYYAFQGRNFTIKCVVYNAGAGSQVLWYKNGARIASTTSTGFDTRSSITWNNTLISTLTKRRVSAEDDATYKCVETNSRMSYGIEVRVSQSRCNLRCKYSRHVSSLYEWPRENTASENTLKNWA